MTTSTSVSKYACRLAPDDVDEIRRAPLGTTHVELARRYHVTPTTIARIRKGQTWPVDRGDMVRLHLPSDVIATLDRASRDDGRAPDEIAADIVSRWAGRHRTK